MPANTFPISVALQVTAQGVAQATGQVEGGVNRMRRKLAPPGGGGPGGPGDLGDTRQVVRDIAGAFTALLVIDRVRAAISGALQPAIEMNAAMADLAGVTRLAGQELTDLRDAAMSAAAATSFTPVEAIRGLNQLVRSGLAAKDAAVVLTDTLALAEASMGKLNVETAATLTGALFREMGMAGKDLQKGLSQVLFLSTRFGVRMEELPRLVSRVRSAMAATGASFEDTAFAAGLLAAQQLSGARAATLLRTMMFKLTSPGIQKALKENFGIFIEGAENINTVQDVLLRVVRAVERGVISEATARSRLIQLLTTTRGGEAAIVIFDKLMRGIRTTTGEVLRGSRAFERFQKEFRETDLLTEMLAKRQGTYEHAVERLGEQWNRFLIIIGGPAVAALAKLARWTTILAAKFVEWLGSNDLLAVGLRYLAAGVLTVVGAIAPILIPLLSAAVGMRVLRVAGIFLADSLTAVGVTSLKASTVGLGAWVKGLPAAIRGTFTFAGAMRTLGAAIKSAFGWISLILIGFELIVSAVKFIGKFIGGGATTKASKAEEKKLSAMLEAEKSAESLARSMKDVAQDAKDVSKPLTEAIDKLTGAITAELPPFDVAMARRVQRKAGALPPEKAEKVRGIMATIIDSVTEYAALGAEGDPGLIKSAEAQLLAVRKIYTDLGLPPPKELGEMAKSLRASLSPEMLAARLAEEVMMPAPGAGPMGAGFYRREGGGAVYVSPERLASEKEREAREAEREFKKTGDIEAKRARANEQAKMGRLLALLEAGEKAREMRVTGGRIDIGVGDDETFPGYVRKIALKAQREEAQRARLAGGSTPRF